MLVDCRLGFLRAPGSRFAARLILKLMAELASLGLFANPCAAAATFPDACNLLSRAEIQAILGAPLTGMDKAVTFRGATTSLCQGRIGEVTLTVRISRRSAQDSDNEATIGQMIVAGGGKVETVRTGGTACATIVPAAAMATEYGYDSMCTISLGEREVAVQGETHRLDALIPAAKLRPLETLAARRLAGSHR